jgi:hypothetical protein
VAGCGCVADLEQGLAGGLINSPRQIGSAPPRSWTLPRASALITSLVALHWPRGTRRRSSSRLDSQLPRSSSARHSFPPIASLCLPCVGLFDFWRSVGEASPHPPTPIDCESRCRHWRFRLRHENASADALRVRCGELALWQITRCERRFADTSAPPRRPIGTRESIGPLRRMHSTA